MNMSDARFKSVLRDWFLGNVDDSALLDVVLNYGLKPDWKKIEVEYREKYGQG